MTEAGAETTAGSGRALRILVADDSVLLREGLVRLLEEGGCDVVAQAGDAEDLLRKVRAHKPDLAVVDVRMPPDNTDDGLRAALTIRDEQPGTAVLVLSQYIEDQYAIELIGEGHEGVGYLLKERITDVSALLEAVHRIAAGGSVIDPQVVSQLLRRHRREDPLELLSDREREVLSLMAEGRSNNAIASELVVTDRAVEKHVTSIFSKLDLPPAEQDHRRVLAVLRFLRA
ncbi:MAG: two component transcriptional regulator, LuxR family [Solirubrobacterales bacterium]|nr:two component transcriptional regulator, LuxR family [Solirubrobacterales bacterium]